MYLPLKEFTNRYIDLIDENGMEHKNDELIAYRNNIHKTYKRLYNSFYRWLLIEYKLQYNIELYTNNKIRIEEKIIMLNFERLITSIQKYIFRKVKSFYTSRNNLRRIYSFR